MDALLLVVIVKAVVEMALMFLAARAVLAALYALSPARADGNPLYRLLAAGTRPFERLARRLLPGIVLDRHLPLAAGALLVAAWVGVTALKIDLCADAGAGAACAPADAR